MKKKWSGVTGFTGVTGVTGIVRVVVIAVVLGLGVYFTLPLFQTSPVEFSRASVDKLIQDTTRFRVDHELRRIYFKKDGKETLLKDIPSIDAGYFFLRGKHLVKFRSAAGNNVRMYTYILLEALGNNSDIDLEITLYRDGEEKETPVAHIHTSQSVSLPIYKDLEPGKRGTVLFKFKGHGMVYFSRPIFYHAVQALTEASRKKARHIFFIGVDTFRKDLIGKRVNGQPLTPNINKFIKDSVSLENCFAQTSWTLPSFMSCFTGLTEYNHGVGVKHSLSQDIPVFTEALSKQFITFGFHGGKVMDGRWGFSRGFDYYRKFQPAAALYPRGGESLFNKAIDVLKQSRMNNLFMFLHTYQVHAPYTPPLEYLKRLNPNPAYKKIDLINFSEPQKTYETLPDEKRLATIELYQAEALAFDDFFGTFIQKLKRMKIYDAAMIVLMSDHGEEFFEHNGWGHSHSVYNELIRVPAVIKFPKGKFKGTRITDPTGIVDLMPTILDYYKIPFDDSYKENLDGQSLMPTINDSRPLKDRVVISSISIGRYFEALPPRIALMFNQYKLIYNEPYSQKDLAFFNGFAAPPQLPNWELYNLETDPGETQNIIVNHRDIQKKMMPLVLMIRKNIAGKAAALRKSNKDLDKEVKEKLESLGYL